MIETTGDTHTQSTDRSIFLLVQAAHDLMDDGSEVDLQTGVGRCAEIPRKNLEILVGFGGYCVSFGWINDRCDDPILILSRLSRILLNDLNVKCHRHL